MVQHTEFTSIVKQARGIAYLYKVIGLYSTVLLTAITVVSMTNVFLSGAFARYPWIAGTWAFVFAATIDLNIVRMFIEAAIERTQRTRRAWIPMVIGSGLALITGAALFIEGVQQSVGFDWNSETVKRTLIVLILLRVFLVVVLMAREGTKLGTMLSDVLIVPSVPEMEVQSEVMMEVEVPQSLPELPQMELIAEHVEQTTEVEVEPEVDTEPRVEAIEVPEFRPSRKPISVKDAAELIGCSERHVRNLRGNGTLESDGDGLSAKSVRTYARQRKQKQSA